MTCRVSADPAYVLHHFEILLTDLVLQVTASRLLLLQVYFRRRGTYISIVVTPS